MVKPVVLRLANTSDLPAMIALFVDTITQVNRKDYTDAEIQEWTKTSKNTERWEKLLEEQYVVVAELDQNLVGFASLKDTNYLDFMYVSSQHQREGIANLLYQHLEKRAIALGAAQITSDVSITAEPFFSKQGFRIKKKNHNVRGSEVLINFKMEKVLANV